jgi:hypothetical protein
LGYTRLQPVSGLFRFAIDPPLCQTSMLPYSKSGPLHR